MTRRHTPRPEPELKAFLDEVVIPLLVARYLREYEAGGGKTAATTVFDDSRGEEQPCPWCGAVGSQELDSPLTIYVYLNRGPGPKKVPLNVRSQRCRVCQANFPKGATFSDQCYYSGKPGPRRVAQMIGLIDEWH